MIRRYLFRPIHSRWASIWISFVVVQSILTSNYWWFAVLVPVVIIDVVCEEAV
jgi:hypothetical protein